MTRPLASASLALLLVACGPGKGEPNTTDDASTTDATESTTASAEDEPFGFVCASIRKAGSAEGDPFAGTAQIRLTLKYDQCLIDYYNERHPEHRFDAAEGAAIVDEWRARLCSESVAASLVGCEVESLAQTFDDGASKFEMSVTYQIADPTQIDGRVLLWGPGPVDAAAECEAGQLPSARMTLPGDIVGLDAGGAVLWNAQSWAMPQSVFKHAATGCIEVDAGPM
ncbi:hypothetical protein SAMN02745121_04810 [Nannocystis exedens]|uniref:Lipoprotein n=1 Tax=Nannocystis exedens TaxID=54 RepID=A0A1I2BW00_9BACT|nr:hypothetical protein [Nannocystis exedens]PCC71227.1 hypothetical protein NAEX_04301 [Nannocystis exedens]SFE60184.1 hypothetical protein SAMN02745121_04810 [Nannocystis exedens]